MAGYDISSHASALTQPLADAKMRLRADYDEPRPAAFAGTTVALTGNA
jgi:hypothetical protein